MLRQVPHPLGVNVPQLASPMRFGSASGCAAGAPPTLGQHSTEILGELGYSPKDIAGLRAKGAI